VSVRAADNLEFANPSNPPQFLSQFAPQGSASVPLPSISDVRHAGRIRHLRVQRKKLEDGTLSSVCSHCRDYLRSVIALRQYKDVFEPPKEPRDSRGYLEFEPQGSVSEIQGEMKQELVSGHANGKSDDNRYRVNFGECIGSIRTILRRFDLSYVWLNNTDPNLVIEASIQRQSKYPLFYGYDPAGIHSAKGLVVPTSNFPFNYVNVLPYHLIAPCFAAQRGSMNWIYNVDGRQSISSIKMVRVPQVSGTVFNTNSSAASGTDSFNTSWYRSHVDVGCGGQVLTSQWTNAGLNVTLPNYNPYRFQNTNCTNVTAPAIADASDRDFSQLEISLSNNNESATTKVWKYVGIGADWNPCFFLNVPTFYNYGADPTPN